MISNYDKYLETCYKLRKRYQRQDGNIVISKHGAASRYRILESMAAVKYLGCDASKLGLHV